MAFTAEQTARNAEADHSNEPGYCLQQCRIWAGINSMYGDASTAWRNTNDRHPGDRNAPRGAAVYWTGGSQGYGHIAISVGGGNVRSTDAGGQGVVATRSIEWFDSNWPALNYAGWAWDINEATIIHTPPPPKPDPEDEVKEEDITAIARRVNQALGDFNAAGEKRPGDGKPDTANARIEQIENVVRRIEKKVDDLSSKRS